MLEGGCLKAVEYEGFKSQICHWLLGYFKLMPVILGVKGLWISQKGLYEETDLSEGPTYMCICSTLLT